MAELGEVVRELSRERGEPAWLLEARLEALALHARVTAGSERESALPDFGWLVEARWRRRGRADALGDLRSFWAERGVSYLTLEEAAQVEPDRLRRLLAVSTVSADPHDLLNAALFTGGALLTVPEGVHVGERPAPHRSEALFGPFERTAVVLGPRASLHLVEGCARPLLATDALRVSTLALEVGDEARLQLVGLGRLQGVSGSHALRFATVGRGGQLTVAEVRLGEPRARLRWDVRLGGHGARAALRLAAVAAPGSQRVEVSVRHDAPRTRSEVEARLVALGPGDAETRGHLGVAAAASGVEASWRLRVLLADAAARGHATTERAVAAPDAQLDLREGVVGLDPLQRYYLRTRGLTDEAARSCGIGGFLAPVFQTMPRDLAIEVAGAVDELFDASPWLAQTQG